MKMGGLKWVGIAAGALAGFILLMVAAFYGLSELRINKTYHREATVTHVLITPDLVASGKHLAVTRGCIGCHKANFQGQPWWDDKVMGRQYTANLTRRAQTYSDADFDRAIRGGVNKQGKALWDMPSAMYANLTDADTAAIIAYIRSLPVSGPELPGSYFGPGWRWEIIRDAEPHSSARRVDDRKVPYDPGPAYAAGRYIAMTACSECHGDTLEGKVEAEGKVPDLNIAASYSEAEFERLMRLGIPVGGRKLVLMDEVAKGRFAHFSDEERAQLHAYLKARAAKQAS